MSNQSVEALWTIEFDIRGGWTNGGVVVLESGRLYGGDSQRYYIGSYQLNAAAITASLRSVHYFGPPDTAFGMNSPDHKVELAGQVSGDGKSISGKMWHPQAPQAKLSVRMVRREALP